MLYGEYSVQTLVFSKYEIPTLHVGQDPRPSSMFCFQYTT